VNWLRRYRRRKYVDFSKSQNRVGYVSDPAAFVATPLGKIMVTDVMRERAVRARLGAIGGDDA
jgi:hypothetical protein